ncbi:MAG: hypothetical protein ACR5LA_06500, partial [Wolbachia sp.]
SKIILLHFYSWVTSLLFDNMFPEFTLFSSLFYRFLIRNWGYNSFGDEYESKEINQQVVG